MLIEEHYIITEEMKFMTGHFDRHGNLCTLIHETERLVMVNKSPLKVLDYSIRCIGFDLRGAMDTSKWLLDQTQMCPIMINPILRIVLFPTKSHLHEDNIWFNPHHIMRTIGSKGKTKIQFSDGSSITIPARLSSFNHKLQTAEQLKTMTIETANKPFTLVLNPRRKKANF